MIICLLFAEYPFNLTNLTEMLHNLALLNYFGAPAQ